MVDDWAVDRGQLNYNGHMTIEFEMLMSDPDLQSTRGPGGTLIFLDGDQYCVVGPEFVSMEESECFAHGSTREQALANYAIKNRKGPDR